MIMHKNVNQTNFSRFAHPSSSSYLAYMLAIKLHYSIELIYGFLISQAK